MFKFDLKKIAQIVNYILKHTEYGSISYMKLIKELYIADKKALKELGSTISGDKYYSLPRGPILSKTFDLIKGNNKDSLWSSLFFNEGYDIKLLQDNNLGVDELSDAEIEILDFVFNKYKNKDKWEMVELTHEFKEWQDPKKVGKKRLPLHYKDIMESIGWSDNEIADYLKEEKSYKEDEEILKECYA